MRVVPHARERPAEWPTESPAGKRPAPGGQQHGASAHRVRSLHDDQASSRRNDQVRDLVARWLAFLHRLHRQVSAGRGANATILKGPRRDIA